MAKQVIGVGTSANDGTGDPIRDAFVKVNANFTELYTDDAGDVNSIIATAPIARDSATGNVTISLNNSGVTLAKIQNVAANSVLVRDANSSGVLTEKALATTQILIGDGTGMTAAALSGDATMTNAGVVSIGDNKIITAKILNDNITHDKLENRFTAVVSVSNRSGATTIDWSAGAIFVMANSLNGGIEFDFTNFKAGQVIDIYNLTGAQTITLDSNAGTSEAFYKVGGINYVGGSTNLLQITCLDDSANAKFAYVVQSYVSDTTV